MSADDVNHSEDAVRLELDAPLVPLPVLVSAAGTFANLVAEVSRDFLQSSQPVQWTVKLEQGSVIIPTKPQLPETERRALIHAVAEGMAVVEERAERPPYFNDRALVQARALGNLSTDDVPIRVRNGAGAVRLTKATVAHVDQVTGDAQPRIGTVEGKLEAVDVHGRSQFVIWERRTGDRVECLADVEVITLDDLRAALGRRVAVRGRIRATKGGTKRRVDATELRVFPAEEDLPSADDVRGILRAS